MFVYIIKHNTNPSLIYVGSTEDMESRIRSHKTDCYNENFHGYNYKKYQLIRANGGFDSFYFQVIDVVCTADTSVLREFEQYYIDHFKSLESMNSRNAVMSSAEYYQVNRIEIIAKHKEHYKQNRDEILAKNAEYRKKNRDQIKSKQNAKRALNRDEYIAKYADYRENNRDRINAKQNAKRAFIAETKRMRSIIY